MRRVSWSVYVLRCADGSLYTGVAIDVHARFAQHAAGKGARYTRGRGPLVLLVSARCRSKSEAHRVEHALKQLPRARKLEAACSPARLLSTARRRLAQSSSARRSA